VTTDVPRLRMFAGPNGSGKTTVKRTLDKPAGWYGTYINPDDLEKTLLETGELPVAETGVLFELSELQEYFRDSEFLKLHGLERSAERFRIDNACLSFGTIQPSSYHTSVLADFIRRKLLAERRSFSFETVMSAPDKVELLREAQAQGYRTFLYYVATEDPAINVERVQYRVAVGGHDVPEEKIISRYVRSLALVREAIRVANRAFFFDTSEVTAWYFAEVTDGAEVELKGDEIPNWFRKAVWDLLEANG